MKLLILVLSLSLGILPTSLFAQGYAWHPVTQEEAVQAVRHFEANPSLDFKVTRSVTEDTTQPGKWRLVPHTRGIPSGNDLLCSYSLSAGRYQYGVNYYTEDEFSRTDTSFFDADKFYGQPYDPAILKPLVMSEGSAQVIAQAFVSSHYPEPARLNKVSVKPDFGGQGDVPESLRFIHSYQFSFDQDCGNGVMAPAGCYVEVDAIRGQVISFVGIHYPVLISSVPRFTGDETMAIAMNALDISDGVPDKVEATGISKPDSMGQETLYHHVTFSGRQAGAIGYQRYYVAVDANTGEIEHWGIANGIVKSPAKPASAAFVLLRANMAKKPASAGTSLKLTTKAGQVSLNYPPLAIHGEAYLYANYLCEGVPDAKISTKLGEQIDITSKSRQVSLRLNSQSYRVNGQARQMSAKPVLLNGRCYVPLDVVQTVLGGKWSYDAKAKTVRYDPPPVKMGSK